MPTTDPRWIRGPADELAISEGCWFDEEAAERPILFIERFCRQSKGRWAGQRLELLEWQRDFLRRLFGWKRADGTRRYRRAYLEVAKKNGKSTLVSALVLYLILADGEGAPEIYLNACDREQARIIFDEASRMVRSSPELSKRLQVLEKRIIDPAGNGKIVPNSADVASKDGVNPSAVIFDELHRQPNRELWDIFEYAGEAREQPLTVSITTAGESTEGVWFEQREYSEKVNRGEIPDTAHLGVVYRALETDDIDDPETWRKANPSLGATIREDDFAAKLAEAKEVPVKLRGFLRLRLNIIAGGDDKFLGDDVWTRNLGLYLLDEEDGEPIFAGLDLSTTTDITALVWVIGDTEQGFDVRCRFYLPEANIVQLERKHRAPYRTWADAGLLTLTDGEVIDYSFIRRDIRKFAKAGNLAKLTCDPHLAVQLLLQLRDEDGLPVETLPQGFISLGPPTRELERLALAGRLRTGNNPILRWMAGNAIVETDAAGNIKLSKRKSRQKIDGMAALVNAIAGATRDGGSGDSPYEHNGVFVV